jgi:hypothetical protein
LLFRYPNNIRLAPLFDNGTSLGHERFPEKVAQWTDNHLDSYIFKGTHHVKWVCTENSGNTPRIGHIALLQQALSEWPKTKEKAAQRLNFTSQELSDCLSDLPALNVPVRLSTERYDFMLRLLNRRHEHLRALFE